MTVERLNVNLPNGVDGMSLQKQPCLCPFFSAPLGSFREERGEIAGWLAGIGCVMIIETRCKSDAITASVLITGGKVSS